MTVMLSMKEHQKGSLHNAVQHMWNIWALYQFLRLWPVGKPLGFNFSILFYGLIVWPVPASSRGEGLQSQQNIISWSWCKAPAGCIWAQVLCFVGWCVHCVIDQTGVFRQLDLMQDLKKTFKWVISPKAGVTEHECIFTFSITADRPG